MYKLVLCLRYLRTRPIGLASIISVMLGVMTMIVVNSVMEGFSVQMRSRVHGVLSDVIVEARSLNGEPNAKMYLDAIQEICGDQVESASEVVAVPAMLSFRMGDGYSTRRVQLVGVDPEKQGKVTEFCQYLQHPENRKKASFDLREDGYPDHDWNSEGIQIQRPELPEGGWKLRRRIASYQNFLKLGNTPRPVDTPQIPDLEVADGSQTFDLLPDGTPKLPAGSTHRPELQADGTPKLPGTPPSRIETAEDAVDGNTTAKETPPLPELPDPTSVSTDDTAVSAGSLESLAKFESTGTSSDLSDTEARSDGVLPQDPFMAPGENPGAALHQIEGTDQFDMARDQNPGAVLGITIASARVESPNQPGKYEDRFLLLPGNDVNLVFTTVGNIPQACNATFTITDFYESRMTLYDSSFVFVPIRTLQELRGMIDPVTGEGGFSQILIKVKPGVSSSEISKRLADNPAFPPELFAVYTWEEQPEVKPLLDAVKQELVMINMLLFLIIAVAGFGILAIFFMIVFEKTRDIGILKSLGASSGGIMVVFLSYGLALGCVGCGLGVLLGLLFVRYINTIAQILAKVTGLVVFDPSVYYFYEIPTVVEPMTVIRILLGALFVAVIASVLPAIRAARLHPVRALRHE